MGGRALKSQGIDTIRLDTAKYQVLLNEVGNVFNTLGWDIHVVNSYSTKDTHGDLDILLKHNKKLSETLQSDIYAQFSPKGFYKNGNVHSFEFNNFQIDAITIPDKEWETSKTYFDYDPTGNIMGKTAHKFGLKYGFGGLVYPYRSETSHLIKNINISQDNREIFTFLGYNYSRFLQGFETLEDIFAYLVDSDYFDPQIFQFENLNHIDRKRNKKRKTYNQFLEFINSNNFNCSVKWKDKILYLNYIDKYFPKALFLKQYFEMKYQEKVYKEIIDKFNGKVILEVFPNLSGKQLGDFILAFKFEHAPFDEYVVNTDKIEIINDIKEFYKKYKK